MFLVVPEHLQALLYREVFHASFMVHDAYTVQDKPMPRNLFPRKKNTMPRVIHMCRLGSCAINFYYREIPAIFKILPVVVLNIKASEIKLVDRTANIIHHFS